MPLNAYLSIAEIKKYAMLLFFGEEGLEFLHFCISFKYDFHVAADRMIVKTR